MIQFNIKWCLPSMLLFLWSLCFFGQERQRYVGPVQLGTYSGIANYQYIVSDQDTIYDGTFHMNRSSLGELLAKEDTSFAFEGYFDKGIPNGPWQFRFGKFQSDSQSKVVDYEYRVSISGLEEEGSGMISGGRPDGKWVYQVNRIKDSEVERTLFKSDITFDNGIPQQNFQIQNDSIILVGRFLRNGLAHDNWSSYASDAIEDTENWYFDEGLLHKIRISKDGIPKEISVFDSNAKAYATISIDASYIELLKATIISNGSLVGVNRGVADILVRNRAYYQKIDAFFSQLGATDFLPKFMVKVPNYTLDSLHVANLSKISRDYETARSISDTILNNSHLNIVKRSDSEARYHYDLAKQIKMEFLGGPLTKLVSYHKKGILVYLDLPKLIPQLWLNGRPNTQITVVTDTTGTTKTFVLPNTEAMDFEGNDLNTMARLAEYAKLSLETVKKSLAEHLTDEKQVQTLNGLEEDLVAMNDSLVRQIDSLSGKLPDDFKKSLQKIKSLADASLSNYASVKNIKEKLAFGMKLKTCFGQLVTLTHTVIALPSRKEEIQTLYQDSIWNPFMATVMEEEIKKRITTAYSEIVVPNFLEVISTSLDCGNAEKLNDQIDRTNLRMIELRDEDTRKLERRLRKEKNPIEIIKLFHQQSRGKEKE